MLIKIEHQFDLPEEREQYEIITQAERMHSALGDLRDEFRKLSKYEEENNEHHEKTYELFYEVMNRNNVTI